MTCLKIELPVCEPSSPDRPWLRAGILIRNQKRRVALVEVLVQWERFCLGRLLCDAELVGTPAEREANLGAPAIASPGRAAVSSRTASAITVPAKSCLGRPG